mmetsp:Transcript_42175/g.78436  ORF Transcript_42175/g.78436 Transcript_42175/m.78436 type:complete len:116 (+) Transcript_42175:37-384(+)
MVQGGRSPAAEAVMSHRRGNQEQPSVETLDFLKVVAARWVDCLQPQKGEVPRRGLGEVEQRTDGQGHKLLLLSSCIAKLPLTPSLVEGRRRSRSAQAVAIERASAEEAACQRAKT